MKMLREELKRKKKGFRGYRKKDRVKTVDPHRSLKIELDKGADY